MHSSVFVFTDLGIRDRFHLQAAHGSPQTRDAVLEGDEQPVDAILFLDVVNGAAIPVGHGQQALCRCKGHQHISTSADVIC